MWKEVGREKCQFVNPVSLQLTVSQKRLAFCFHESFTKVFIHVGNDLSFSCLYPAPSMSNSRVRQFHTFDPSIFSLLQLRCRADPPPRLSSWAVKLIGGWMG